MIAIVDTSVWSLVLRRRAVDPADPFVQAFRRHLGDGDALAMCGPIIQELLDGITESDFNRLLGELNRFPLIRPDRESYVSAARLRNLCRRRGIQVSSADALIAACCIQHTYPLLTADRDFLGIAAHSELMVLPPLAERPARPWP